MKKLALGTAQFGLAYGIANTEGQVTADAAGKILARAREAGMDTIDTAIAYGQSEQRLGETGVEGWHVVSKLPAVPEACADVQDWVVANVEGSLARLRVPHLRGLLLHRPGQLLGANGRALYQALLRLKDSGKVEKIGISIYEPSELDDLCAHFAFDLVQAPFNVFDRRLATSGWLRRLHAEGVEIHVRSAFLQGLLLSEAGGSPAGFERWESLWSSWRAWVTAAGLDSLRAALGHVLSYPEIDRVVVGVDSLRQLNEILACAQSGPQRAPETLATADIDLLNPARWPTFL
jgi:aryl-alcohol dehydrogenase-like predicted oxidoreductase